MINYQNLCSLEIYKSRNSVFLCSSDNWEFEPGSPDPESDALTTRPVPPPPLIIGSIVIVLDILLKHPLYDLVPLTCILHSADFVKKIMSILEIKCISL